MPKVWTEMTSPIAGSVAPWWCMCRGVIVMTSTIATWPHNIALSPSQTSPLASIPRTETGESDTPRRRRWSGHVVGDPRHGPQVTAAEHSIIAPAAAT